MKINLEDRNGEIIPISMEIENDKEAEFLLNQLRPKGKWGRKEYRRFLPVTQNLITMMIPMMKRHIQLSTPI